MDFWRPPALKWEVFLYAFVWFGEAKNVFGIVQKTETTFLKKSIDIYETKWYYHICLTNNRVSTCGSVGTGRRARLRILWSMRSCGFKSHLPHYIEQRKKRVREKRLFTVFFSFYPLFMWRKLRERRFRKKSECRSFQLLNVMRFKVSSPLSVVQKIL